MVTVGLSRVEEAVAAKHPGLQAYAACQSSALVKGVGAFVAGSGAAFALQRLSRRRPWALRWTVLLSFVAGSVASYTVTQRESRKCCALWMFLENKEPLRDPAQEQGPDSDRQAKTEAAVKRNAYGDVVE